MHYCHLNKRLIEKLIFLKEYLKYMYFISYSQAQAQFGQFSPTSLFVLLWFAPITAHRHKQKPVILSAKYSQRHLWTTQISKKIGGALDTRTL